MNNTHYYILYFDEEPTFDDLLSNLSWVDFDNRDFFNYDAYDMAFHIHSNCITHFDPFSPCEYYENSPWLYYLSSYSYLHLVSGSMERFLIAAKLLRGKYCLLFEFDDNCGGINSLLADPDMFLEFDFLHFHIS